MICLCANCHERADTENWGEKALAWYKKNPWVLRSGKLPVCPESPRIEVQITIKMEACNPVHLEQLRDAVTRSLGIAQDQFQVKRVEAGSLRIVIELPAESAKQLLKAYQARDPELVQRLDRLLVEHIASECSIEWWGEEAFAIANVAQPEGRTDPTVVGRIHRLANRSVFLAADDPRVFVGVWPSVDVAAVTPQTQMLRRATAGVPAQPEPRNLRFVHKEVLCLVDTGRRQSVFKGEVASDLGLNPSSISPQNIRLVPVPISDDQTQPCLCAEVDLWMDLVADPAIQLVHVPVFFPVEHVQDRSTGLTKCRWRTGPPWANVLGMRGLLNQVMLCFTPEVLYVFPRKR
jgi:hypothetical protein